MTLAPVRPADVPRPGRSRPRGAAVATIDGVVYTYPGTDAPALAATGLSIDAGLTLVTGPSGGGKSTLLRLLNGLVPHYHGGRFRGRALVCGLDIATTPVRRMAREVGFVFQDPESQFVYSTVDREVAFSLENVGMAPKLMAARVEEALHRAGIAHLRHRRIATLSGGERQRVAIASALALRPRLLVLDEPTSQLDPRGAAAVAEACSELHRAGTSLVIAEHRLDRLLAEAGAQLSMAGGRVIDSGRPREVATRMPDPPPLVELGRRLGWPRTCLSVREARELAPRLGSPDPPRWTGQPAWAISRVALGHGGTAILDDLELEGGAGEVIVLMGANGCGKTTLLRALAGLHQPMSGSVHRPPGRVAYLPQDPGALLHQPSVAAEVELTLRHAGTTQPAALVLEEMGLLAVADRYPRDLSSGQRQRAAVAAVLAGEPPLALLDEPTRGMDVSARRALGGTLRRLAAQGSAIVVATHDSDLAAEIADRVVLVEDGGARDLGPAAAALSGEGELSTQVGRLYPGGPATVEGVLLCL